MWIVPIPYSGHPKLNKGKSMGNHPLYLTSPHLLLEPPFPQNMPCWLPLISPRWSGVGKPLLFPLFCPSLIYTSSPFPLPSISFRSSMHFLQTLTIEGVLTSLPICSLLLLNLHPASYSLSNLYKVQLLISPSSIVKSSKYSPPTPPSPCVATEVNRSLWKYIYPVLSVSFIHAPVWKVLGSSVQNPTHPVCSKYSSDICRCLSYFAPDYS